MFVNEPLNLVQRFCHNFQGQAIAERFLLRFLSATDCTHAQFCQMMLFVSILAIPNIVQRCFASPSIEFAALQSNQEKLSTTAKLPRFPFFMRLPLELRQMAYEFTLTENQQPVIVDWWNAAHLYSRYPTMIFPRLSTGSMIACHQIREEVRQKHHSLNDFRFSEPDNVLISWLRDRDRREQLRSLASRFDPTYISYEVFRLLCFCKNMATLKISTDPDDTANSYFCQEFETLHGFASAESIAVVVGDEECGWPTMHGEKVKPPNLQAILKQLRSAYPRNCAGHACRERAEIRVLGSHFSGQ